MIKTDDQTNPQIAVLSTGGTEALIVDKAVFGAVGRIRD